jgi:putative transposase
MSADLACLVIDEFTRECLAIRIGRRLRSTDVIDVLSDLFILRGAPGHVRSDNGPAFAAKAVREWIVAVGSRTAFIEPGSPWENGYCESFTRGCGTSFSTARSSTRSPKPRQCFRF